jgi:ABC-type lipoprotein export system ATPase subunit
MPIALHKIVPQYLEKEKIERSTIWQHEHFFAKGEKIQIVAPSGSGKTSLVHFLYGMRKDYTGTLLYNNKDIKTFSASEWASIRANEISIIFQDLRLFKEHTVLENLEIKRALNPFHTSSNIKEMAERLGIANKLSQLAGQCSYGEQQRIAIIRALQQPYDFIIMDEPFSHLDENNSKIALQLIEEETKARGAGIILADLNIVPFFEATKTLHL